MIKKVQILIYLSFCLITNSYSQKCPPSYYPGEYLFNKSKFGTLCFSKDPIVINDGVIFKTNYKIVAYAEGEKEKYAISFSYDKGNNKILINFKNENTGKENDFEVKFDTKSSKTMFKNYTENDLTINKDDDNATIFTVDDSEKPYISLNQFQFPGNEETLFKLIKIENDKLLSHNIQSKDYLEKSKGTRSAPPDIIDVRVLKNEIEKYRDSVLEKLEKDDQAFIDEIWPREANYEISQKFTKKMDAVFYDYFKKVFPYQDYDSQIEFKFICKADGKINNVKDIRSINSLKIKWLEDSFKVHVMPQLQKAVFGIMNMKRNNVNLITDFNNIFSERINKLNRKDSLVVDILELQKEIRNELGKKMERLINIPTEYTYILNYQSIVKYEMWEYAAPNKKRGEILGPVNSTEPISEVLKSKFRKDIIREKLSKYQIKRCEVLINDELKAEDLKQN